MWRTLFRLACLALLAYAGLHLMLAALPRRSTYLEGFCALDGGRLWTWPLPGAW
jgi:hypothetical protein